MEFLYEIHLHTVTFAKRKNEHEFEFKDTFVVRFTCALFTGIYAAFAPK
tara:strand:- start:397 stop:543 length:147 start_codon:yes stop_codon:yes gene_type:complete